MTGIRKPLKSLLPRDMIGARDITNNDLKVLLLVVDNDGEKITATARNGNAVSHVFSIKDGLSLPPQANLEIYMTPERRRCHEVYGDEQRANMINWD